MRRGSGSRLRAEMKRLTACASVPSNRTFVQEGCSYPRWVTPPLLQSGFVHQAGERGVLGRSTSPPQHLTYEFRWLRSLSSSMQPARFVRQSLTVQG